MHETIKNECEKNTFIICSGSVSMGDKDFLKPVIKELGFKIRFGRVNMKPGWVKFGSIRKIVFSNGIFFYYYFLFLHIRRKPMTFAHRSFANHCYLFGLPGNPVRNHN